MNKSMKICLVIIIIILIIIMCLLVFVARYKNNYIDRTPYILENNIEEVNEDVIIPENSYLFFGEYIKGEYSAKEIYESIYYFSKNDINKYYNDVKKLEKSDLNAFYKSNIENSNNSIYLNNVNEFSKFVNSIKDFKGELSVQQMEFIENSIKKVDDCTIGKIKVKYKENHSISFIVKVPLKKSQKICFYDFNKVTGE